MKNAISTIMDILKLIVLVSFISWLLFGSLFGLDPLENWSEFIAIVLGGLLMIPLVSEISPKRADNIAAALLIALIISGLLWGLGFAVLPIVAVIGVHLVIYLVKSSRKEK